MKAATNEGVEEQEEFDIEVEEEGEDAVAVEDDTPEEDKGKSPMPEEIVQELEDDELDEYSDKVKQRLKQMKKVWHDERRAKEAVQREQTENLSVTKSLAAENKHLREKLTSGERTLVETYTAAANLEMNAAKKAYKEAYDGGDSDAVVEAQQAIAAANYKLEQVKGYKPTRQTEADGVHIDNESIKSTPQAPPRPDAKTEAWQKNNTWWGADTEMTALALGRHQSLEKEHGKQYVGTEDYWENIDTTMRRRFPEYFEEATDSGGGKPTTRTSKKPATVVAPASRSTSPKKIVLKRSQVELAKKLGITNEQYAREYAKTQENL